MLNSYARLIFANPGRIALFLMLLWWVLLVCNDLLRTAHAYPDYGDFYRWIVTFVEPLATADEPRVLAALFSEYEFPGHGHVLTKSTILLLSQYAEYNLHLMRVAGNFAYFLLLALLLMGARHDMQRFCGKTQWWTLALLLALFAHPEEPYSLGNNLLAFEYIFILLACMLVFCVYGYCLGETTLLPVTCLALLAAAFADIAFTLALGACTALLAASVVSRECTPRKAAPLMVLLIIVPAVIVVAGAGENATASQQSFALHRFLQWLSAGLGTALISEPWFFDREFTRTEIYNIALLLGAPILLAILVTAVDQVVYRRPVNLGVALIAFGLLSLVGSFATRNSLGDYYVISPRYVRYSSFAVAGLAWYWLVVRREWLRSIGENLAVRALAASLLAAALGLFFTQLWNQPLKTEHFERLHPRREQALLAFVDSHGDIPPLLEPLISVHLKKHPDQAREAVRFYFQCRNGSERCKIGTHR